MKKMSRKTFNVRRLVSAVLIIPLFFIFVYYLPAYPFFFLLILLAAMLALFEFYGMYRVPKVLSIPSVIIGSTILYTACFHPQKLPEVFFIGITFLLTMRLVQSGSPSGRMAEMGPAVMGLIYIAGFLAFLWYLRNGIHGREKTLLLFSAGWCADSAAYYIGTYFGKKKLCPRISPNKTYEGAVGSILGGAVGAVLVNLLLKIPDMAAFEVVIIGSLLGLVTIFGDLVESAFKRDAGVKDSGGLIPGHGGLLDKLDGVLLSAPALYFILEYM